MASKKIGNNKVIWRYDPIFFTEIYTPEYHLKALEQIAGALCGYTNKCVISFVDVYPKNKKKMEAIGAYEAEKSTLIDFAERINEIVKMNGMTVSSCAECRTYYEKWYYIRRISGMIFVLEEGFERVWVSMENNPE